MFVTRPRGKQCVRRSCLSAVHCGNGFDVGFSSIKVSVCAAKMPSPELGAGQ